MISGIKIDMFRPHETKIVYPLFFLSWGIFSFLYFWLRSYNVFAIVSELFLDLNMENKPWMLSD